MKHIKDIVAPLSGRIVEIKVKVGDKVKAEQTVVILEAMKMDNELIAEYDGTVTSINVKVGDFVSYDTSVISME